MDVLPDDTRALAARLEHDLRERRMRDLLAITERLLGVSQLDELLGEVIVAARTISGSDIAHVNYGFDDSTTLRVVRLSEGEISDEWRDYPTQLGSGVTGIVLSTGAPYISEDYLTDTRIIRTEAATERIRRDGVRTMAGVPLRRDGAVCGALLVSWRSPQTISGDVLADLKSLAALVSVALDRTHAESRRRDELAAVRAAHAELRAQGGELERLVRLDGELIRVAVEHPEPASVLEPLADALGCAVAMANSSGVVIATTESSFSPRVPAAHGRTGGRLRPLPQGRGDAMSAAVVLHSTTVATIVADREELSETEQEAFVRAADVCAVMFAQEKADYDHAVRRDENVVDELLRPSEGEPTASTRAFARALAKAGGTCVVVADYSLAREDLLARLRVVAREYGGIAGGSHRRIVALVPGAATEKLVAQLRGVLAEADGGWVAGVERADEVADLPAAFDRASACADAVRRMRLPALVMTPEHLGFAGMLFADPTAHGLSAFVDRTLGPVIRHDEAKGTALLETVECYLRSGASLQAVAEEMHVHVNTVYKRLQRAAALLGPSWEQPGGLAEIHIAMQLRGVVSAAGSSLSAE